MSSTQSFSLSITSDNCATYTEQYNSPRKYNFTGDEWGFQIFNILGTTISGVQLTAAAKATIYPNAVVHPIKTDASFEIIAEVYAITRSTGYGYIRFDSTDIHSGSTQGETWVTRQVTGSTNSAVINSTRNTDIYFLAKNNKSNYLTAIRNAAITLYFARYDFAATAGSNVSSASVSSSTGYDGDTVTYSCVLASGATFLGWYNGSTLISSSQTYTHIVNGADLTLTAKASAPVAKTLSATYNGAQLSGFPISVSNDTAISYNNSQITTVPFAGGSKTLQCANKIMRSNVAIGSKTLLCNGKLMATNIVATIN